MKRTRRSRVSTVFVRLAALAALLLAAPALLSGCAIGRGIEAFSVLGDIGAAQEDGAESLAGTTRRAMPRAADGPPADLYLPAAGRPAAALLLVPGLAETGKDDPRVVALAASLARARIAVLVPDLASLRELRAGPENVAEIAAGLRRLVDDAGGAWRSADDSDGTAGAADRPVGVAAVSYAVGPALLATLTPDLAGEVDFLIGVGGYYDMTAALTFATTGWYRDVGGPWVQGAPNVYGKWAFMQANAGRVADPSDRTTLAAMARRKLADAGTSIDDLAAALGPEGRAVYDLVANEDRERVGELIAELPATLRQDLAALDVSARDLSAAPPHVLLLHGRDDAILPASESVRLAEALGPERVHLALLARMAHARFGIDSIADGFRLWRAVYWLLAVRDGAA